MAVLCTPTGDKQVQLRRGTTAQNDAFTGADGELSFDTDENRLRVHDGVTAGGFRLGFKSEIDLKLNLTGGTLSGDLDIAAGIHLDTDGTIIAASGAFVISSGGLITFPDNVRQIFNPGANNAGINVGALAGDPSAPVNGDLWYDSTANELTARINGVNVSLGSGGSTPPFVDTTAIVMGSVDNTKLLRFEVDGFSAGVTRVLTPQNADYIIAGTNISNSFTQNQSINGNISLFTDGSALFASGLIELFTTGAATFNDAVTILGSGLFADFVNVNSGEIVLNSDGSASFGAGNLIIEFSGAITFLDNLRQTFNPGVTVAGLNVGSLAGDPSTPINGDIWYDSTANELTARINGANVSLGSGGSSPPFVDSTALVMGSADNTKLLRFEVDGFTTGITRVLTPQNANYTIAGLEVLNIFTTAQQFNDTLIVGAGAQTILNPDGSATFSSGALQIDTSGSIYAPDGSDLTPSYNFLSDGSTGFYREAAGVIGYSGEIKGNGHISPLTDNTYDLGLSASFRWRDGWFGRLVTANRNSLGTTPTESIQLSNTTAAAAGAQQYSPSLRLTGQGWKTNATAASQPVDFRIYVIPVQGSANPTANLNFDFSVNGGAFTNRLTLNSGGQLSNNGGGFIATAEVRCGSTASFQVGAARSRIASSADGLLELFDSAQTSFTRLNFGGTSSSFPALTRNAAILETKLADNSAYATHAALFFKTMTALVALGGGATPTFGTIGGSGPAAAAQNTWLQMKDSTGADFWVPAWK